MNNNIGELKNKIERIHNNFQNKDFKKVISECNKLILVYERFIPLYNLLGLSYERTGKLDTAIEIYNKAIKIDPNNISPYVNLSSAYLKLKKLNKCEKILNKVKNKNNLFVLLNLGKLHEARGNFEKSIIFYKKIYEIDKKFQNISIKIGNLYLSLGKFDLAKNFQKIANDIYPNNTSIDFTLSNLTDYSLDQSHQDLMIKKLKNNLNLNNHSKIPLSFALGKSYNDQKDFANSYKYYDMANSIRNSTLTNYNLNTEKKYFETIKNIFNDINFNNINLKKSYKKKIIFIIGLPRSGTSLIHQIIASHSKIKGLGESEILNSFFNHLLLEKNFLDKAYKKNKLNLIYFSKLSLKLSSEYEAISSSKIPLDKSPFNFFWIGFIKILFPEAKIIHISRNIEDNYSSIFKSLFGGDSVLWSYDQKNIAEYINLYLDILKFWRRKLPNYFYELKYEDLVKNQKYTSKEVLKFCDLDWETDCLKFYTKPTPIKSASLYQTRKPIYSTSLNYNLNFKSHLKYIKSIKFK